MDARELRIGNYVNMHGSNDETFCEKGQPRFLSIITGLNNSGIFWEVIGHHHEYYHTSIEPIPLTDRDWET